MNKCLIILALISVVFSFDPASKISSYSDDLAKFYLHFASAGYCKDEQIASGTCCTSFFSQYGFKTIAHGIENDYNYNYGVFKSTKLKKIVVAVPGTRDASQLVQEILNSKLVAFDNTEMRLNKFFKERAEGVKSAIFKALKSAIESKYQIVFTGHSLGAAVSSILAYFAETEGVIKTSKNDIILITYGQPRTGNDVWANELMKKVKKVFRISREGDIVTTIPPCDRGIIDSTCASVFGDLFDPSYKPKVENEMRFLTDDSGNNYWHLGGLIMIDKKDMTKVTTTCEYNRGENWSGDCKQSVSVDVSYHNHYYFTDKKVSQLCQP